MLARAVVLEPSAGTMRALADAVLDVEAVRLAIAVREEARTPRAARSSSPRSCSTRT